MNMKKKYLTTIISVFFGMSFAGAAQAEEDFPSEPIHIVAVWPAGGSHDVAARLIANQLSKNISTSVVVDNVTGAAGSTGMRYIEDSEPDGYTIGIMGMHAISQSFINTNATHLENIEPLVYVGSSPGTLEVNPSTGVENLDDYIKAMRNPSSIINGNDPQGGNSFIFARSLEKGLGTEMIKIPYAGHAPTITALVSGEIQSATLPIEPILEHHRAETVKVLGVMSEERHELLPDVPTFKEKGYDVVANDFYMIVLPKDVPDDKKEKLEALIIKAISSDNFRNKATKLGMLVEPAGNEEAKESLSNQVDKVYPLLLESGLVNDSLKID